MKASCAELYSSAVEEEPKAEKKTSPNEERTFFKEEESNASLQTADVCEEGEVKDKKIETEDQPSECAIC